MRTQHGSSRGNGRRINQTSVYGIIGGLAPTRNASNSTIRAFRMGGAKLRQDIPLGAVEGLAYMKGANPLKKNMLSVNPLTGGIGRMYSRIYR